MMRFSLGFPSVLFNKNKSMVTGLFKLFSIFIFHAAWFKKKKTPEK